VKRTKNEQFIYKSDTNKASAVSLSPIACWVRSITRANKVRLKKIKIKWFKEQSAEL